LENSASGQRKRGSHHSVDVVAANVPNDAETKIVDGKKKFPTAGKALTQVQNH
jgi:hypothetical protein